MGLVNGFIFEEGNRKVYIAGDTSWCEEVKYVIDSHKPTYIVAAGGAAIFSIGDPVAMTADQIKQLSKYATDSNILITHLESVSPCVESREKILHYLQTEELISKCKILEDGEEVELES